MQLVIDKFRMLRLLLFVVVATYSVQAVEVAIRYDPPVLGFTLPLSSKGISGVVFNYAVGDKTYMARGVKTSEGWQFLTRNVNLDGVDTVYANAVVYDVNGNRRMTTPRSSLTLGVTRAVAQVPSRRIRSHVVWRDDFNSFDKSKWNYDINMYGSNGEFQMYTNDPKNVFTKNGELYIYPIPTVNDPRFDDNFLHNGTMDMKDLFGYCTKGTAKHCHREAEKTGLLPPIMSGKIMSVPTLKYGIVEVRARIPKGDWIWPAIWLVPKNSKYGVWPRSGEIDIMESRGNDNWSGIQTVSSTLHYGTHASHHKSIHGEKHTKSWHDDFHIFKMVWTPEHITTYVDDKKVLDVTPTDGGFWEKSGLSGTNIWESGSKMAPFDQDFLLILNVAVGGTSGMFWDGMKKPWDNHSPKAVEQFWDARNEWLPSWQGDHVAMKVDYVQFSYL